MSLKKKKKILLIALVFVCCFLSAGYLVLINGLVINGKLKFGEPKFDVRFKNINTLHIIGDARNFEKPVLTPHEITFFAEFNNYGDTIVYDINIKNVGNIAARLEDIHFVPENLEYIDYTFSGLLVGEVLEPNEVRRVKVKLKYISEENLDEQFMETKLTMSWHQKTK